MITSRTLASYMNSPRPFSIHLADGREIKVPHGEFLWVKVGLNRFIVETYSLTEIFNLNMVTSVKQAKPGGRRSKQM